MIPPPRSSMEATPATDGTSSGRGTLRDFPLVLAATVCGSRRSLRGRWETVTRCSQPGSSSSEPGRRQPAGRSPWSSSTGRTGGRSSTIIRRVIRASTAVLVLAAVAGCGSQGPNRIALVGATVIDGSGGDPRPDAVVMVRAGEIEAVVARAGFTLPKHTREIDVRGKWIVPGLIDA